MLNSFIDTGNRLIGIFYSLNNIDMGTSGDSVFFAMEAIKSGVQVNLASLENIAKIDSGCIDVNKLSLRIVESLRLYIELCRIIFQNSSRSQILIQTDWARNGADMARS